MIRAALTLFLALATVSPLWSQSDLKKLSGSEVTAFDSKLKSRSQAIETLIADFRQEKSMEMLKNKMVSKGVFKYKKEDKIAFLYSQPMVYHMIINGQKLRILSNGKNQIIDLKNNPVMREVRSLIAASFLGNLSQVGTTYKISYFDNKGGVVVVVVPQSRQLSSVITRITIYFKGSNAEIERLKIEEGSGSATEYIFTNQRINTDLTDEDFRIN
jgi:outer membrane lipoprotein-sorting protein